MRKVNVSTKEINRFAGQWVAIKDDRIIAVGETLDEISPLVTQSTTENKSTNNLASAFKVPYKDESPYALNILTISFQSAFYSTSPNFSSL